jgi:hypothetical protein
MSTPPLDSVPGYRRRFIITPHPGHVRSELEDDFHHMGVDIRHADGVATTIDAITIRAPWTTCPAAVAQLEKSFLNVPLHEFRARGETKLNCTHLYDLALLGAAHAYDPTPLTYDVLVSDPVDGRSTAQLRRDGERILSWTIEELRIVAPPQFAGRSLFDIRQLLESMDEAGQEALRVLRWGTIVARGRVIPMERQSDASAMPPNCFTFQPDIKNRALRVIQIKDFSDGRSQPLAERAVPAAGSG